MTPEGTSPGPPEHPEEPSGAEPRADEASEPAPPSSDAPASGRRPQRSPFRSVLRLKNFRRLWIGLTISSLGDWVALFALLSMTNRLAPGEPLAVGGLMIFRMIPAFLVGPLGGVLLDRIDRRRAMVVCDISRALIVALLPFATTLLMLYAAAFLLETIALIWMPAKDSLVPTIVPNRWLVAANSLALFTTYGVFPLGAVIFTGLVGVAELLGDRFAALEVLRLSQENLAFWINTVTFFFSAFLVSRIRFPPMPVEKRALRLRLLWDEVVEGLRYLKQRGEVARVMRTIGVALAGAAVIFSLGAPYTTDVLGGGPQGFGLVVAALGTGMGLGVVVLGFIGDRLPKAWVSAFAVIGGGLMLVAASLVSDLRPAILFAGLFGGFGGIAYATGFALLQERVAGRLRGRTFASVQIIIRVSLFASLIAFPALAEFFATDLVLGSSRQGIRLAMALGGLLTCAAGFLAAHDVYRGKVQP